MQAGAEFARIQGRHEMKAMRWGGWGRAEGEPPVRRRQLQCHWGLAPLDPSHRAVYGAELFTSEQLLRLGQREHKCHFINWRSAEAALQIEALRSG